jgi:hypothetical protein
MTVEREDEFEPWPGEIDPINAALCPLLEVVFAHSRDGSAERKAAMSEVLQIAERIRAALAKPTLN